MDASQTGTQASAPCQHCHKLHRCAGSLHTGILLRVQPIRARSTHCVSLLV